MKNIINAVNEFKGEWDNGKEFIYIGTNFNGINSGVYQFTYYELSNNTWDLICNEGQFNQCVDEMATNYGTSETYTNYKANYEMINDDMKPVTVPTFTHTTKDIDCDGEIYQIGALYIGSCNSLIVLKEYKDGEFTGLDSSGNIYTDDFLIPVSKSSVFPDAKLGTVTKAPIVLEDGKAYQFDCNGHVDIIGVLNNDNGSFYDSNVNAYNIDYCTNIKPLTLEVTK